MNDPPTYRSVPTTAMAETSLLNPDALGTTDAGAKRGASPRARSLTSVHALMSTEPVSPPVPRKAPSRVSAAPRSIVGDGPLTSRSLEREEAATDGGCAATLAITTTSHGATSPSRTDRFLISYLPRLWLSIYRVGP